MQRRGGSGQPVKGQSANRPKARNAPTAQVSTADLQEQLDRRTRERDEALEQQTATSRCLRSSVFTRRSSSPCSRPSCKTQLRICEAKFGAVYLCDGDGVRSFADTDWSPPHYRDTSRTIRAKPDRSARLGGRAIYCEAGRSHRGHA